MWICTFCGNENLNEDRIAFQEPQCTRCKIPRKDPNKILKERDAALEKVAKEQKAILERVADLKDLIAGHEHDIAECKILLNGLQEAYKEWETEKEKLEKITVVTEKVRFIPVSQVSLLVFW